MTKEGVISYDMGAIDCMLSHWDDSGREIGWIVGIELICDDSYNFGYSL
jgi:hypothetical protein